MGYFAAVCCFMLVVVASGRSFNRGLYDRMNDIRQQYDNRRSDLFTQLGYIRHGYNSQRDSKHKGINLPLTKEDQYDQVKPADLPRKYDDKNWKKEDMSTRVKNDENVPPKLTVDNRHTAAENEEKTEDTRVPVENDEGFLNQVLDNRRSAAAKKDEKEVASVSEKYNDYSYEQLGYKVPAAAKLEKEEDSPVPEKNYDNYFEQLPYKVPSAEKLEKEEDSPVPEKNYNYFKQLGYKVPAAAKLEKEEDSPVPEKNDHYFEQLGYKVPAARNVKKEEDTSALEKNNDYYFKQLGYKVPAATKGEEEDTSVPEKNDHHYFEQLGYEVPAARKGEEEEDASVPEKNDDHYFEQLGYRVPGASKKEDTPVPAESHEDYFTHLLDENEDTPASVEDEEISPIEEDSTNVSSENEPKSDAAHDDKDKNEMKRNEEFLDTLAKGKSRPHNHGSILSDAASRGPHNHGSILSDAASRGAGPTNDEKKRYNDLHELQLNREFYDSFFKRQGAQDQRRRQLYFNALRQRKQAGRATIEENYNNEKKDEEYRRPSHKLDQRMRDPMKLFKRRH